MDNKGQSSAEFILLFGGIIVVVLLVLYFYRIYINDFTNQLKSGEVNTFNKELSDLKRYFS